MSNHENQRSNRVEEMRALRVVEVPMGLAAVEAVWDPVDQALAGEVTIALVPDSSQPLAESITRAVEPHRPVSSDVAIVLSTSGSTGHPRGVQLSTRALTCMTENINALAGGDPSWILAIPATSIGGLNVLLRARATGREPVAVSSLGGAERFTDEVFAIAVSQAKESNRPIAVSLVPAQLPRLLASSLGRAALADCSLILVGGAALTPHAARDCQAAGITVTTTYGMTETSGGCVLNGEPLPGVQVRIDDSDGRIHLSGPILASGYRDGANEVFSDNWLRTNDRGRWNDGRLEILGRLDDIVTVQGVNVDLVAIEDRLLDHPDISSALALPVVDEQASDTRIHIAYLGDIVKLDDMRAWVAQALGASAAPHQCYQLDSFAMTASGKVDRIATAQALGLSLATAGDEVL
jgi:O-succinylbenzoic acid--CoA ligase